MNTWTKIKIKPIQLLLFIAGVVVLLANVQSINKGILMFKYRNDPQLYENARKYESNKQAGSVSDRAGQLAKKDKATRIR